MSMQTRETDTIDVTAENLIEVGGIHYPETEVKAAIERSESNPWIAGLAIIGFWALIFGVGAKLFG